MLEEMSSTVLLALGAATLGIVYILYKSKEKKYNLPPGPKPLPIVGNLLQVGKQDYMFVYLKDLAEEYGDVFKIYMGPKCVVVLSSIDVIREAYLKKGVEFANRPDTYTGELLGTESIAMGQYTPEWKIQRKIAHSALRTFAVGEPLEILLHNTFDDIVKDIDGEKGAPFDPYPKLTSLIYNVLTTMVFGRRFEHDDPFFVKLKRDIDKVNEDFGNGSLADIFPIFKYFPNATAKLMKSAMGDITKFLKEMWDEHQATFNPDELSDFVYHVIAAKKEAEKEDGAEAVGQLTEEHYLLLLSDMFFAGTDTSRMTLCWVIGVCVAHPEIQAKVHAEIDEVVGPDQPICLSHRPHLSYTEAVLHEAMRMYPVVPLSVPRATSCDTDLRGYDIPKDTWIMPNLWALHHDPKEWDEPEKFKPERHLDENGKLAPKPNSYLPFSTGRRVCVGESVAKVELHLLTAMLFQRYTFLPSPEEEFKLECMPGLIAFPRSYKIVAKPRE